MFNEVLIDNSRWVQRRKKYVLCRYVDLERTNFFSYVNFYSFGYHLGLERTNFFSYVNFYSFVLLATIWILKEPTFFLMLTFILLATSQLLFFWLLWVFFWLLWVLKPFVGSETNFPSFLLAFGFCFLLAFGFCGFYQLFWIL